MDLLSQGTVPGPKALPNMTYRHISILLLDIRCHPLKKKWINPERWSIYHKETVNYFKLEETKIMLMRKFKSLPPFPPLPTQLARGTGAWGQHYLSYKIFEIVILLVYLTFIAFVIDPRYHPWINQSILLYGISHVKGDWVINQSLHSECCTPVTFDVGSFF